MASNVVRMNPAAMPPQPSQQDWVWDGANWTWCGPPFPSPPACPPPFPCPPPGFPTPCPPWFPPPAGQAPWYPGANGGVSFSATAPVNPVRGNFWWDGTMLHLFDGAAWVSIGPGAPGLPGTPGTTGKTQVTFAIQQSAALTVTPSTWVPIPFSATPMVDTQGAWTASSLRLTPKVAGLYLIEMRILSLGTAGGVAIVKNDPGTFSTTDPTQTVIDLSSIGAQSWMTAVGVVQMNGATDFVRAWGFEQSGTFPASGGTPAFGAVLLP